MDTQITAHLGRKHGIMHLGPVLFLYITIALFLLLSPIVSLMYVRFFFL